MSFESEWGAAKHSFEVATGKKKPSGKFLGVFHTSGISDRLKKIDTVLSKGSLDDVADAYEALGKDAANYSKTLLKTAKEDSAANYGAEAKKLSDALDHIVRQTGLAVNKRAEELRAHAKAEAEAEAMKEARNIVSKMLAIINPLLAGTQREAQAMAHAIDESNRCLGQLLTSQMRGDAKAARASADQVKKAVETLTASRKKIDAAKTRADEVVAKGEAALKKLELPKLVSAADITESVQELVLKFGIYAGVAETRQKTGAATLQEAADALRGAIDTEATYTEICHKLVARAAKADDKCTALVRDIDEQADVAEHESRNAGDAKEEGNAAKQAASVRSSTDHIRRCRIAAENAGNELKSEGMTIRKALEGIPAEVRQDKKYHAMVTQVAQHFESLRVINENLKQALRKCDRAEAQLETL